MEKLDTNAKDSHDFEVRVTEAFNGLRLDVCGRLDKIEPMLDHTKDVSVFARVQQLVTAEDQQARFDLLNTQLEKFASDIETYMVRVQALEGNFKQHVDVAFKIVQTEFENVKEVINGVHQAATHDKTTLPTGMATDAAIRVQLGHLKQSSYDIRDECRGELIKFSEALKLLQEGTGLLGCRIDSANEDLKSLNQRIGGGFVCHCDHLDLLDGRVKILEALANAASAAAPVRQPPNVGMPDA